MKPCLKLLPILPKLDLIKLATLQTILKKSMHNTIHKYEEAMLKKILTCNTTFEVIAIIDRKVNLIEKKCSDKSILNYFINSALFILKDSRDENTDSSQLSKLRVAICHFQNLKMHYKIN